MEWLIALVVKPFAALAFWVCLVYPLLRLFHRFVPDGKIKRFLLRPIGKQPPGR